jgi:hypothetical protein
VFNTFAGNGSYLCSFGIIIPSTLNPIISGLNKDKKKNYKNKKLHIPEGSLKNFYPNRSPIAIPEGFRD